MNIYKISQTDRLGYDTYDSAVVVAAFDDEAREMHPGEEHGFDRDWLWENKTSPTWAKSPNSVIVEYIGVASAKVKPGIVVASFHAG